MTILQTPNCGKLRSTLHIALIVNIIITVVVNIYGECCLVPGASSVMPCSGVAAVSVDIELSCHHLNHIHCNHNRKQIRNDEHQFHWRHEYYAIATIVITVTVYRHHSII